MPLKRITAEQFQALALEKGTLDDETVVIKTDAGLITKAADNSRRCSFKLSSASPDRDRDIINQSGWRLDNYLKNPVVLWGHQYYMPPVASCPSIGLSGGNLIGDADFFDRETYEWADTIFRLVNAGGLRACSVGFRPLKYNYNAERGGVDIEEQELLEWSIVSVPANPEALVQLSAKIADGDQLLKDFVKGCERVLDQYYGCEGIWIPRAQVEKAFDAINKSGVLAPKVTVAIDPTSVKDAIAPEITLPEPTPNDAEIALDVIESPLKDADAVVLELTGDYTDTSHEEIHKILSEVIKGAVAEVIGEAKASVEAEIDYQLGRVR